MTDDAVWESLAEIRGHLLSAHEPERAAMIMAALSASRATGPHSQVLIDCLEQLARDETCDQLGLGQRVAAILEVLSTPRPAARGRGTQVTASVSEPIEKGAQ